MNQVFVLCTGEKTVPRSQFLYRDPSPDKLRMAFYFWVVLTDSGPIVGCNANASNPHYEPSQENTSPDQSGHGHEPRLVPKDQRGQQPIVHETKGQAAARVAWSLIWGSVRSASALLLGRLLDPHPAQLHQR